MPGKNLRKDYIPQSFYHVYNRGVEKRRIFLDDQDYNVFLSYLKIALSPADEVIDDNELSYLTAKKLRRKNLHEEVELLSYCLMPNHYHLMVYQHSEKGISNLIQSIMTGYVMYFNRKHKRVGHLFQDRYKASHINNEAYLWHISRYIHLNPSDWQSYSYSSLDYYRGNKTAKWLKPAKILQMHAQDGQSYEQFLRDHDGYKQSMEELSPQLADS